MKIDLSKKSIATKNLSNLPNIVKGAAHGDRLWNLLLDNVNARDENKFNRRASEKIWKDASNELAEHLMHLNPAYAERLAPKNNFAPPKKRKYEFDSLLEDLT